MQAKVVASREGFCREWPGIMKARIPEVVRDARRSPCLYSISSQGLHNVRSICRLTHSTEVYKPVLPLFCVDEVISALLGGSSLQHCFKQWARETSVSGSFRYPISSQLKAENSPLDLSFCPDSEAMQLPDPLIPHTERTWNFEGHSSFSSKTRTLGTHDYQEHLDTAIWGKGRDGGGVGARMDLHQVD